MSLTSGNNLYVWQNDALCKNEKPLIEEVEKSPLEHEVEGFIKNIEKNTKPETDGRFGLKVNEILDQVKRQIES